MMAEIRFKIMVFVVFLLSVIPVFCITAQAETVGKGARIIVYGVPEQARFHLGAEVGESVELTAEATGKKTISEVDFVSSDSSVCSVTKTGDHWTVSRLKEGTAVIRMSCKADNDTVVRTLLMSNLVTLNPDSGEDSITGVLKEGNTVYLGCSDKMGITSYDTEIKDTVKEDTNVEVVSQCGDYYRIESDETVFGDDDEMWGYVKKNAVHIPVKRIMLEEELTIYEKDRISAGAVLIPRIATNKSIKYTSSNTNVVIVSEDGTITGLHKGSAIVTAKSEEQENVYAKCRVTVKPFVPVTGIEINPSSMEIEDGTTGKIGVKVLPEDASESGFTWQISREDILKVDSKGRYQALKPGTVMVTVVTKEGNFTASCEVKVKLVAAIGIYIQNILSVDTGETRIPVWRMIPSNATNKSVTWSSDNPEVARVDKMGRITGVRPGMANIHITAEDGGYHSICQVTVERYIQNIHLANTSFTISPGTTKQMEAEIIPKERTKENIVWKSSSPSIVTVTQSGKIKALRSGTAKVLVYDSFKGAFDYAMVHVKISLKAPKVKAVKKGKKYMLSWNKVNNATGYNIYQYKKNKYVKVQTLAKKKLKYVIKKAKKGAKYKVCATYQAQGEKSNSKYSKAITIR